MKFSSVVLNVFHSAEKLMLNALFVFQIRETNSEINQLMEKRMLSSESSDKLAGLGALRQQVNNIFSLSCDSPF